jgi:SAM-dependent methyltransferase
VSGGTTNAQARRIADPEFPLRYFVGTGVDMGSGGDPLGDYAKHYPLMTVCYPFDKELGHGDTQDTDTFPPDTLDFIHSSHLLEHVEDPYATLTHWLTLLKPGGYIISIVPDEDMYEQGVWPSQFNSDHKHTFTIAKTTAIPGIMGGHKNRASWSPVSIALAYLLPSLHCTVERICRLTAGYEADTPLPHRDQSAEGKEVGIEFVIRKPGGVSI